MIQLPSSTAIHRVLPKEAFYKHLKLRSDLKQKFVTDILRITLTNSLTATTLNLESGTKVTEILVLTIELKKQQYDKRILEKIARQNTHQLLFELRFEDQSQLAVYHAKLYTTEWLPQDQITLAVNGLSIDKVWQSSLEQIALQDGLTKYKPGEDLDTRLARQENVLKLKQELEQLKKRTQNEIQPKKKFELYEQLQDKEKLLEEMIRG